MKLRNLFRSLTSSLVPRSGTGKGADPASPGHEVEQGLMVFENTAEVIRAERLLRERGLPVKVMGPPPDLRTGCDMVLVFPLLLQRLNPARKLFFLRRTYLPAEILPYPAAASTLPIATKTI